MVEKKDIFNPLEGTFHEVPYFLTSSESSLRILLIWMVLGVAKMLSDNQRKIEV